METKKIMVSTQTGDFFNVCTTDKEYLDLKFKEIKECGFEAIDYNFDWFLKGDYIRSGELTPFWDKSLDELYEYFKPTKEAALRHGIEFSQSHASFPLYVYGNDKVNEYMINVMEKTLAVCKYLGCPAVVAHPVTHDDKETEQKINFEMYRKMIPAAKKYGVKVCLENMFVCFNGKPVEGACSTADEACAYIDALNKEAGEEIFGFCLDVGHANLMGRNIKRFITTLGNRLTCFHIHDNNGIYDFHLIPYTQNRDWGRKSCTDWDGLIEGLREINYRGNLSFETFMGVAAFPEELETEALKLISAIGRYFRDKIIG